MTMTEDLDLELARRLRHRRTVDRLDYLRTVRRLARRMTQAQLGEALHMSQPAVSQTLKSATEIPDVVEGFSGGSPYEIAERYAAGEITREQLIDELSRWSYTPMPVTNGYDDDALLVIPPGTFEEVGRALDQGLIDDQTYDAILDTAHSSVRR